MLVLCGEVLGMIWSSFRHEILGLCAHNNEKVWYFRSSEQCSPRREYQECETSCARAFRPGEHISPKRVLVSVVWFCLSPSLRKRVLLWAAKHLAQTRCTRLSEKSCRVWWFCLSRRLGESFGVRRRASSPKREGLAQARPHI